MKSGKEIIIVTGASSGIGKSVVDILARDDDNELIMACRNLAKGEKARQEIIRSNCDASVRLMHLDIASFRSIRSFVEEIAKRGIKPTKLLNNAGTMCRSFSTTEEGFETTMATNYVGTYLLTKLMMPLMADHFNIVNTVSISRLMSHIDETILVADKQTYSQLGSYGKSKLALLVASTYLSKNMPHGGVLSVTDPGIVNSQMITLYRWFDPLTDILFRPFCKSTQKAAIPAINALYSQKSGQLFHGNRSQIIPKRYARHPLLPSLIRITEEVISEKLQRTPA